MANPSMKGIASVLASKGRNGDTMLMHVTPSEVQALDRMGVITINPETELPEAFKLKDLLPFVGSAVLGPAFKAIGFSPGVSSFLASTASTMLGGGSLEKGIMSGMVTSSLGRLGTALSPEASKAAAADTGYRFGIFKKPTEGTFGQRYAEAFQTPQFNPVEMAKAATEGGLDKFFSEAQKPGVMIPFMTGTGELARMSAEEAYRRQMTQMEQEAEERRRRIYARNPQVLPPSSPYYRGGAKEGGLVERKQLGGLSSFNVNPFNTPSTNLIDQIGESQAEQDMAAEDTGIPPELMAFMTPYTSQARNDQERADIERAIGSVFSVDASRGMTGGAPGAFENFPARLQAAVDSVKDQYDFYDQVRPLFAEGKYKEAFELAEKLGKENLDANRERMSLMYGTEFPEESQQTAARYMTLLIEQTPLQRITPPMNAEQMQAYYNAIPLDKIPLSELRGTGVEFVLDGGARNVEALAGGTGYPDFFKYAVAAKKDVNLLIPTLQVLLAFAGVPAALGNTIAGSTVGTALGLGNIGINSAAAIALGSSVIGAAGAAVQGGDFEDVLKAGLIAGGLGYLTAPQTLESLKGYLQDAGLIASDAAKVGVEVVTDAAGNVVTVSTGGEAVGTAGQAVGQVGATTGTQTTSQTAAQDEILVQAEREAAARLAEEQAAAEAARLLLEQQEAARIAEEQRIAEQQRLAEEARVQDEIRVTAEREAAAKLAEEQAAAEAARLLLEQQEAARIAEEQRIAEQQRLAEEARVQDEVRVQTEREAARIAEEQAMAEAARQLLEQQEAARQAEEAAQEEFRVQTERDAASVTTSPPVTTPVEEVVVETERVTDEPSGPPVTQPIDEFTVETERVTDEPSGPPVAQPIEEFVIETERPTTEEPSGPPIDEFTVETYRQNEPLITSPPVVLTETPIDLTEPQDINTGSNLTDYLQDYLTQEAIAALVSGLAGGGAGGGGGASGPVYQGTGGFGYIPEGQERRYIAGPDDYLHGFLPEWMFFENLNPPAILEGGSPGQPPSERGRGGVPGDEGPIQQDFDGGMVRAKPKIYSPRDYLEMVRGYNMGGVAELPVGEKDAARNLMTDGNKDLIDLTRAVILGEVDERADEIIQKFIDLYGYEEFQSLRDQTLEQMAPRSMKSGLIRGQTGGMDDMVDGVIGSRERVAVSPGEFIVPADVVAALGDGNTEKGGKELEKMMERTRMQKYGSRKQPPPVNLDNVMPA